MTDDDMTGPWVIALGALAIGAGAAARLLRRRDAGHDDASRDGDVDRTEIE